jgi:Rieske Fe-S protein
MESPHHISRREFVALTTAAVGALIGAVVGLPAIAYLLQPALKGGAAKDTWLPLGKMDSFPVGKPTLATFTRSKVNGWEKSTTSYGVFVYRKSETDVVAFSNVCTHLSCHVNWDETGKDYVCPCHDGHFNINGKVTAGPPPRPLDTFETRVEDGTLSIHFVEG